MRTIEVVHFIDETRARMPNVERTIFVTDNRLVVELPDELLAAFDLRGGSRVRVILDAECGGILITPTDGTDDGVDEEFDALIDEIIEKYRPALEALAKR